MADLEGLKVAKDYHIDTPFANQDGFYVKGANSLDWGMKRHLANIFNPKSRIRETGFIITKAGTIC